MQLITKGYLNNFATAIVGDIIINENNDLLLKNNIVNATETIDESLELYLNEVVSLKNKYGLIINGK